MALLKLVFAFSEHVDEHRAVLERFDFVPLVRHEVYGLCVFRHNQLTAFLAHDDRASVTHSQVGIDVPMARQTLPLVGVIYVQRRTVVGDLVHGVDELHHSV